MPKCHHSSGQSADGSSLEYHEFPHARADARADFLPHDSLPHHRATHRLDLR